MTDISIAVSFFVMLIGQQESEIVTCNAAQTKLPTFPHHRTDPLIVSSHAERLYPYFEHLLRLNLTPDLKWNSYA